MFKRIILALILISLVVFPIFSQGGTYTTYGYFYLPLYYNYGAQGLVEYNTYNTCLEVTDNQIEANKTALTVSGATAYSGASPTSWTDLNLSSIVGGNSAMVILQISATSDMDATAVRMNGDTAEYHDIANESNAYGVALGHHDSTCDMVLICVTDTAGIIEWITEKSSTATIKVIAYIK